MVEVVCVFFVFVHFTLPIFFFLVCPLVQYDIQHVRRLSKRLVDGITSKLDHVIRNGDPEHTYEGKHMALIHYFGTVCAVYERVLIATCSVRKLHHSSHHTCTCRCWFHFAISSRVMLDYGELWF